MPDTSDPGAALVLSGGIALGAFHGGAAEALAETGIAPGWIVGASIGAVAAVLLAGGPAEDSLDRVRRFWGRVSLDRPMKPPVELPAAWRGLETWSAAIYAHIFGRPGLFTPRLPRMGPDERPSLYDLSPLRTLLNQLVDFGRVNNGPVRVTITATDLLTGERRVFDTERGHRITVDHVLASSAFIPLFQPVEVDNRLLVDGGYSANLPVDLVLEAPGPVRTCYAADLFSPIGRAPKGIVSVLSRAGDLIFGNQSRLMLDHCAREQALRAGIARLGELLPEEAKTGMADILAQGRTDAVQVVLAAYRGVEGEAGPEKGFDFSRGTLERRWAAGRRAMQDALR